jgi:DNA helicase IV
VSDDNSALLAEREYVELAQRSLEAMWREAEEIADYGVNGLSSEGLGRLRAERMRALAADPDAPPFFGRTEHEDGEVFYFGRRHIRASGRRPVVLDWRAPIARAFYRATPADPMDVHVRRRYGFRDGLVTSFEDEDLRVGDIPQAAAELLRREIERPRVGPMRDIVATIQPDQDELVCADLDTSLCIQGAPGTGKTAVGLHRAAFLLYTFPKRLGRSGVLVVGPNDAFLTYIGQVLPSLGELDIEQTTVEKLVQHGPVLSEATDTAVLKGDARMARVLRRAVDLHVSKPAADVIALVGTSRFRIPQDRLKRYVDDLRRSEVLWGSARDQLRRRLAEDVRRQREDTGGALGDSEMEKVARSKAVREFADEVWPQLDPQKVLRRLYVDGEFRQRCCAGILEAAEQDLLTGRRGWTGADWVLIDELASLIEPVTSYVHVVVDEAQDLSAMQCRVIARCSRSGSITVLGDQAQATSAWAIGDWQLALEHLGHPDAQLRPLTTGYRVPAEVLGIANRLLPHIAPTLAPATSMRSSEQALVFSSSLRDAVATSLEQEGSVGVIVADDMVGLVLDQLSVFDAVPIDIEGGARCSVVAASAAKGLEFDSVVVLEPASIVAAEPSRISGLRRLYVTLTRAVSRLTIVHTAPLPSELSPAAG